MLEFAAGSVATPPCVSRQGVDGAVVVAAVRPPESPALRDYVMPLVLPRYTSTPSQLVSEGRTRQEDAGAIDGGDPGDTTAERNVLASPQPIPAVPARAGAGAA